MAGPPMRTRFIAVGVVGLLACILQIVQLLARLNARAVAVSPGPTHWMSVKNHGYKTSWDLWSVRVESEHEDDSGKYKINEDCRGYDVCEAQQEATKAARGTTFVALLTAAVACLPSLGFACRACCPDQQTFLIFRTLAAVLAAGGLVGLAGAANYKSKLEAACDDDDYCSEADAHICNAGCALAMVGGILAMIAGGAAVALAVACGGDEDAPTAPAGVPLAPAVQMTTTGPSMQVAMPLPTREVLEEGPSMQPSTPVVTGELLEGGPA